MLLLQKKLTKVLLVFAFSETALVIEFAEFPTTKAKTTVPNFC